MKGDVSSFMFDNGLSGGLSIPCTLLVPTYPCQLRIFVIRYGLLGNVPKGLFEIHELCSSFCFLFVPVTSGYCITVIL